MNYMVVQSLVKYAEYNSLINDIYGKLKFSPYRNNLDTFWLKNSRKIIDNSIKELLGLKLWTTNEKRFLNKLKSLMNPKSENKFLVTISAKKVGELVELSIEALIERDKLVQEEVYKMDNYLNFRDALYLLGANEKLLKIIKDKLNNSLVSQTEIDGLNSIASSLVQSYLFISGQIKETVYLKASLQNIKGIWRKYHPLEEIEVV